MLGEGQDALYVEFFEVDGMTVNLRERELYTQLVALAFVRLLVNRLGEDERVIQPVELLPDHLGLLFRLDGFAVDLRLPVAPHL